MMEAARAASRYRCAKPSSWKNLFTPNNRTMTSTGAPKLCLSRTRRRPRAAPDERITNTLDAETQNRGDERPCHDVSGSCFIVAYCRARVDRPGGVHARERYERDEQS